MLRHLLGILVVCMVVVLMPTIAAFADDGSTNRAIQEEVSAIPVTLPTIAYAVDGHFLITSPDSIPLWAPLVGPFLDKHG